MRALVFGGRDFVDKRWLFQVLDAVHIDRMITCIVEGEVSGADLLTRAWIEERGVRSA
jgi:hypothetical protein